MRPCAKKSPSSQVLYGMLCRNFRRFWIFWSPSTILKHQIQRSRAPSVVYPRLLVSFGWYDHILAKRVLTISRSYLHATSDCVEYINPSSTRILGSCTGLLAGVAASSSRGLSDLPNIGVTLVRVAFRIGVLVASLGDSLQQNSSSQESWSTVITGLSEDAMRNVLDKSHADNVRTEITPPNGLCVDLNIDHAIIKTSLY